MTTTEARQIAGQHGLYGRDHEVERLLSSVVRAQNGHQDVVLIPGRSGTGKTCLARSMREPTQQRNGVFISGKFNQYDRNLSFVAWRHALAEFCKHILAGDEAHRKKTRQDILDVVSGKGQLLVDFVPEFEQLLGSQCPVDSIGPQEARHRFSTVVRDTLRVVCTPERPLVLFLDDWQWADPASLNLLEQVGTDVRYMLIIAAYRSDEVDRNHAFTKTIETLRNTSGRATSISTDDLSIDQVESMLRETVAGKADLIDAIFRLTNGNPFFLNSLVRVIKETPLPENIKSIEEWLPRDIVTLFREQIARLDATTSSLLSLAACLGNRFDLRTLANVSGKSPSECETALRSAAGLVAPIAPASLTDGANSGTQWFRFVHDRVQQAAYSRIDASRMKSLRLYIARRMLMQLSDDELEDRIYEIVEHLNAGAQLISEPAEIRRSIELNITAARKAWSSTAFHATLVCHRAARAFLETLGLGDQVWNDYYDLVLTLYLESAESEFLEGDQATSEVLLDTVVTQGRSSVERARALNQLVVHQTLQAKYAEAIESGRRALKELGVDLPNDNYAAALRHEIDTFRQNLDGRNIEELVELPVANDDEIRVKAQVLIAMGPPCYRAHQDLWSVIVPKVVNLTLMHGSLPQIGYSYTAFAGLLAWVDNDYETGAKLCDVATRLMSGDLASASDKSVFHLMIGSSCRHWSSHLEKSTKDYEAAVETGRQSANLQYAAYAFGHNMYCSFFRGIPLSQLLGKSQAALTFSRTRHNQWAIDLIEGGIRIYSELTRSDNSSHESDWESEFIERLERNHNQQVACIYFVMKSEQCLLLGDAEAARHYSEQAKRYLITVGTQGLLPWPEYVFSRALALLDSKDCDFHTVDPLVEQLEIWADACPENFLHKLQLVKAEYACAKGDQTAAAKLYAQAIQTAHEAGFVQWEGFASERYSKFWRVNNEGRLEHEHWQFAYDCFQQWGATAKLKSMQTDHLASTRQSIACLDSQTRQNESVFEWHSKRSGHLLEALATWRYQKESESRVAEIESAADTLRSDLAEGRRAWENLQREREAAQQVNTELEERVRARTRELEKLANGLKDLNTKLTDTQTILQIVIDQSANFIGVLKPDGTIVEANDTSLQAVNATRNDVLGRPFPETPWWRHSSELQQRLRTAIRTAASGQDDRFEASHLGPNGEEIVVDFSISPVKDESGEVIYLIPEGRDITKTRQRELQLEKLVADVEKSNEDLEQFAYVASHDLQEPLRKIASYCQLLQEEQAHKLDEEGRDYLDVAINGARRLQTLIRDLLTFSRITTRGKPLQPTDATESLNDAIENLSLRIEESKAVIRCEPLPKVMADAGQLTRLFQNLISNAIKYCTREVPELHISAIDQGGQCLVSIRDNGIGIDEDFHEQIFRVFQRLHNRKTYSGTGIGLALCKRIVERFGGEITVESSPGLGSTFSFTLNKAPRELRHEAHDTAGTAH